MIPQVKGLFIRRSAPKPQPRPVRRNGKPCDPERVAEYRELVEMGLTVAEIAAAVGRSKWTVYSNLNRYGLRAVRGYRKQSEGGL